MRGIPGRIISIYCGDSVMRAPARRPGKNDGILLRDIGRAVARIVIDEDHGSGCGRLTRAARAIAALSAPAAAAAE